MNYTLTIKHFLYIYLAAIIIVSGSCSKFVDIDLPIDQVQTVTVFNDPEAATAAIIGLYAQLQTTNLSITNGGMTAYAGLTADELHNTSSSTDLDAFYSNNIPSNNSTISSRFWSAAYKYIYHANRVIEGLAKSDKLSNETRLPIEAEARFIRAFIYHYMINLFGDVPLILTTNYKVNAVLPRTPVLEIKQHILEDLLFAYKNLPVKPFANNARPCKNTAAAFLARFYLFEGDWSKAMELSTEVINADDYQLEASIENVFLLSSKETIWQIPKDAGNTVEGTTFVPTAASTSLPAYQITNSLITEFTSQDKRLLNWVNTKTVNNTTYYYPYKYKERTASPITEGYIVMRLAEQYLIRAEANLQLHKPNLALIDLNEVRQRAGLTVLDITDTGTILSNIISENRKEFFAEWGHRWFLLKRMGSINDILGSEKQGWKPSAALYPIPFTEINKNPFLVQNPGY